MINVAVLGSTGSIGTQTLDVIDANPGLFRVSVLVAHSNHRLLRQQIEKFQPDFAVLANETAGQQFIAEGIPVGLDFQTGEKALLEAAAFSEADVVLNSLVGFAGLAPSIASIKAGKTLAIANKETLVAAGALVMKLAAEKKSQDQDKEAINFGSQIRTYTLQPYRLVKDHRTGFQTADVNGVMDGKIDGFIKAYLMEFSNEEVR